MYPYGSKDLRLLDTAIQVPFPIAVKVHHLQTAWGLADWGLRNCWVEEDKDSGKDVWYFDVLQLRAWGLKRFRGSETKRKKGARIYVIKTRMLKA